MNKDILTVNIIKTILKTIAKIIHFRPATEEERLAYAKRNSFCSYSKDNGTTINPASGLPMVGCLDVNGNSFGSNSSSDHCRGINNDSYSSSSPTNYSSYDPFNNRY